VKVHRLTLGYDTMMGDMANQGHAELQKKACPNSGTGL